MTRRRLLAAGLGTGSLLVIWLALGLVAGAVASRAAKHRGVDVSIGRAWIGLFSVHLRKVQVRALEGEWIRGELPRVDVDIGALLGLRRLSVLGGEIRLNGTIEEVRRRLRSAEPAKTADPGERDEPRGPEVAVDGLRIRWLGLDAERAALEIDGLRAQRLIAGGAEQGDLKAESVRWSRAGLSATLRNATGRFSHPRDRKGLQFEELRAGPADIVVGQSEDPAHPSPDEETPDPPVPPSGLSATSQAGSVRAGPSAPPALANAGALGPPRGEALQRKVERLRDHMVEGARWTLEHVSEGAKIEVAGLGLLLSHKDQRLNLGPANLTLSPKGNAAEIDWQPGGTGSSSPPFRMSAVVPVRPGDIVLRMEGGPITLASLGVHENDFQLIDVGRATLSARAAVTLSPDAKTLAFDADGRTLSLALVHAKLASEPVRGIDLAFRAKGSLNTDGSAANIEDGEVSLGGIRLLGAGHVERGVDYVRLSTRLDVSGADCQHMFASIPPALVPKLAGTKMVGSFSLKSSISLDSRRPEDIEVDWKLANHCRIVDAPAAIRASRFHQPFTHTVYDEQNHKVQVLTGPGTADWVPIQAISPYLEAAVTTTEDGGFRGHGGFDKTAIKNSLRDDLRTGKFLRGASTITMQVAKNLYLDREKSLSRKLQEAILTTYLEQELSKDDILELYFNIVEFGPMVYGVGPAAHYYFNTTPYDLSLGQALFLSSILPAPKRTYFGQDGQLSKGWAGFLRRVMAIMHGRHKISDQELKEGLTETLVLHAPKPIHVKSGVPSIDRAGGPWLPPEMGP